MQARSIRLKGRLMWHSTAYEAVQNSTERTFTNRQDFSIPVAVEVWRSTNCQAQLEGWSPSLARQEINGLRHAKNCDLLEIGRSHLGNPGIVVGSKARLLLQSMNLALYLRHLVV